MSIRYRRQTDNVSETYEITTNDKLSAISANVEQNELIHEHSHSV